MMWALRILILAVLLCSGLSAGVQYTFVRELLWPTLGILLVSLAGARYFGGEQSHQNRRDAFAAIACLGALLVFVTAVRAASIYIDTGITGLRFYHRFWFYAYFFLMLIAIWRGVPPRMVALATLLWFLSFPFLWVYVWNPGGILPLVCAAAYLGVEYADDLQKVLQSLRRRHPVFLIAGGSAWLWFVIAGLVAPNYYQSIPAVGLSIVLVFLFLFTYARAREDAAGTALVWIGVCLLNLGWLAVGAQHLFRSVPTMDLFFAKKDSLGGVNSNDAGGWLVFLLPLLVAVPAILRSLFSKHGPQTEKFAHRIGMGVALGIVPVLGFLLITTAARFAYLSGMAIAVFLFALAFVRLHSEESKPDSARSHRRIVFVGAGVLALMAGVVVWLWFMKDRSTDPDFFLFTTLRQRFALWTLALNAIAEVPLFGTGANHYSVLAAMPIPDLRGAGFYHLAHDYRMQGAGLHAHNLLLQLCLDAGIPFAALILFLTAYAIESARRSLFVPGLPGTLALAAGTALVSFLLQGLMNYHFIQPFYAAMVLVALAVLLALPSSKQDADPMPSPAPRNTWPAVAALILCVGVTYHGFAVFAREQALEALEPYRHKNAWLVWVLKPRNPESSGDPAAVAAAVDSALPWLRWARTLYPADAELENLAGESHLLRARHLAVASPAAEQDLHAAAELFRNCSSWKVTAAHCHARLAQIGAEIGLSADAVTNHKKNAERLDPFRLREKGFVRPF